MNRTIRGFTIADFILLIALLLIAIVILVKVCTHFVATEACDDGNQCTVDIGTHGGCKHLPIQEPAECRSQCYAHSE